MACKSIEAIARDRTRAREWYRRQTAERRKEIWLKRAYGIDLVTYEAMIEAQHRQCAICHHEVETLHVDHDHETNKIRGLLCGSCNRGIGLLQHDSVVLRDAITYLEACL